MKIALVKNTLLVIVLLCLSVSCDIIPENRRLIDADKTPMERVVLLEDYTGQKCVNCPLAHDEIDNLKAIYGEKLVVVGVHAGVFALKSLSSNVGNEYNSFFKIDSYPKGVVNRRKFNDNILQEYTQWGEAIQSIIWIKSGIEITLDVKNEKKDSTISIKSEIKLDKTVEDKNLMFQLWIVENGIKGVQYMPDGSKDREYIHNHVLRDAINGTWGEKLEFEENKKVVGNSINYSYKDRKWNIDKCEIIAFVYNAESKEIVETVVLKLK